MLTTTVVRDGVVAPGPHDPAVLIVMGGMAVGLAVYFRRRGWW